MTAAQMINTYNNLVAEEFEAMNDFSIAEESRIQMQAGIDTYGFDTDNVEGIMDIEFEVAMTYCIWMISTAAVDWFEMVHSNTVVA